jgi:hypothetical protein
MKPILWRARATHFARTGRTIAQFALDAVPEGEVMMAESGE